MMTETTQTIVTSTEHEAYIAGLAAANAYVESAEWSEAYGDLTTERLTQEIYVWLYSSPLDFGVEPPEWCQDLKHQNMWLGAYHVEILNAIQALITISKTRDESETEIISSDAKG